MLRIAEEILVLIIDSEKGGIHASLSDHSRDVVIAGAVLMDLALEQRIDTDLQQLFPVDPTPLGDDLLDSTLADICAERITATPPTGSLVPRREVTKSASRRSTDLSRTAYSTAKKTAWCFFHG